MRVRKPTTIERATVDQQASVVIDEERDAPDNTNRHVQILVPGSPGLLMSIDHPTPLEAGPNRAAYKFAQLAPGSKISFYLQPRQKVYLVAESGIAFPSIITQYLEEG